MSGEIVENSCVVEKKLYLGLELTLTLRKYVHIHAGGHLSLSALEAVSKTIYFDKCAPKLFVEHCWAVEGQNLITL